MATKKQKVYSKKRGLNKRRKTMKGGFGWEDLKRAIGLSSATSTTYDETKQPDDATKQPDDATKPTEDEVKPIDNDTGTTGVVATEQDGGKKQKKSKSKSNSKSKSKK